jgi:hypothetical protein
MPISQFESPAKLQPDGSIKVRGDLQVDPPATASDVDIRFMLVQGDVVVEGTGKGSSSGWAGTTAAGQGSLKAGIVQAIGLGVVTRKGPNPGYEPFTWSGEIDLAPA